MALYVKTRKVKIDFECRLGDKNFVFNDHL